MENKEFLHHLNILKDMLKKPDRRIILMHVPYTESQQRIIDAICRESRQIIGQIERKPPIKDVAKEIDKLITAHTEPFIPTNKLQYVVLGRQQVKS